MSAGELRVGQVIPLEFTVKDQDGLALDLAGASALVVKISDPNNNTEEKPATFVNSGTDGKVFIVTDVDDLALVGKYKFQVIVTLDDIIYPSDILEEQVHENLP